MLEDIQDYLEELYNLKIEVINVNLELKIFKIIIKIDSKRRDEILFFL